MASLFSKDIMTLQGVGEKRAKLFQKLGAPTVGALLRYYPRGYEDWSRHTSIAAAPLGELCTIRGTVLHRPTETRIRNGMTLYKTIVTDGDSDLHLTFFNNRYIPNLLTEGTAYLFYGKVSGMGSRREMSHLSADRGLVLSANQQRHEASILSAAGNPARSNSGRLTASARVVPSSLCSGEHTLSKNHGISCDRTAAIDF